MTERNRDVIGLSMVLPFSENDIRDMSDAALEAILCVEIAKERRLLEKHPHMTTGRARLSALVEHLRAINKSVTQ